MWGNALFWNWSDGVVVFASPFYSCIVLSPIYSLLQRRIGQITLSKTAPRATVFYELSYMENYISEKSDVSTQKCSLCQSIHYGGSFRIYLFN